MQLYLKKTLHGNVLLGPGLTLLPLLFLATGPGFDLAGALNAVGAQSFAHSAKRGNRERLPQRVLYRTDKRCIGSIAAHPCTERKDGAPSVWMARTNTMKGWATHHRPPAECSEKKSQVQTDDRARCQTIDHHASV
jgi:hypothetical protein